MKKQAPDVRVLLKRLMEDDTRALAGFYEHYSSMIYLYAFRLLNDEDDAMDVTSKVFIRFWTGRKEMEGIKHVQAFLYTVTRNTCIDTLRSRKRTEQIKRELRPVSEISSNRADYKALRSELVATIYKEVKKLPSKKMQDVFVLRFIEQIDPNEISEILQITPKDVYNISDAARKKIKAGLFKLGLELAYLVVTISISAAYIEKTTRFFQGV